MTERVGNSSVGSVPSSEQTRTDQDRHTRTDRPGQTDQKRQTRKDRPAGGKIDARKRIEAIKKNNFSASFSVPKISPFFGSHFGTSGELHTVALRFIRAT